MILPPEVPETSLLPGLVPVEMPPVYNWPANGRVKAAKPLKLTNYERPEHELQIDAAKMFERILLPRPKCIWYAVDSAGSRDMTPGRHGVPRGILEAQKFKRRGGKKGVPDFQFHAWRTSYFIELKKNADADVDEDQEAMLRDLIAGGYEVAICWDLWQVFERVKTWGLTIASASMDRPR